MSTPAPTPADDAQVDAPATGDTPPADAALPRDAANWARGVTTLRIAEAPEGAITINVNGRRGRPAARLRQDVAEDLRLRLVGANVDPLTSSARGKKLRRILAPAQSLLWSAHRHRARRNRHAQHPGSVACRSPRACWCSTPTTSRSP